MLSWRHNSVVRKSVLWMADFHWYVWSMVYMWPFRGQKVHYGSTNQANSAFRPSEVGKWVVIHVITWIAVVETIKWRTRAAYGC